MRFDELTLIPPLLRAVEEAGYQTPSPIQEKAIPSVLTGRDLLACAQTGTGKTAAFALPILQLLTACAPERKNAIRVLVLTPTRELALQIEESFEMYGKYLPLRAAVIFGGVGQNPQVEQLRRGVDILVATPGRLNDLIGQGHVKLDAVEVFVLDEADRMLDMGFVQDVKKVLKKLPDKKQTLLFSATMPAEIVELANGLLHQPVKVFVTPVSSTVESIDQTLYKVDKVNKRKLLAQLLRAPDVDSALVFTRTKHGADKVARDLARDGIPAMAIHGNKSQNARQGALARFRDRQVRVLVATDIAARGLDISELSHVINYDLPNVPETYVHRIGRTGRAGRGGVAISFCCFDELPYLKDIERLIGFAVPEVKDHAWPMQVFEAAEKKQGRQGQGGNTQEKQSRGDAGKGAEEAGRNKRQKAAAKGNGNAQKEKVAGQKAGAAKPAAAKKPMPLVDVPKEKYALREDRVEVAAREAQQRGQPQSGAGKQEKKNRAQNARGKQAGNSRGEYNPYENRSGGKAIVTRKPIWNTEPAGAEKNDAANKEGDANMGRNNRRRGGRGRGGKNRNEQGQNHGNGEQKAQGAKQNENGVFDFSEEELAQDDSLKVISRTNSEVKYANFEDFLKHQ